MDAHDKRVSAIAASVRGFYEREQKFRINHGSTNSTRNQDLKDKRNVVNIGNLNNIISIDADELVAVVEPNVPMDRLAEATLEYNCIPPVVMDFPGITTGGGYAGTACESSSFKHGYFDRTIVSLEMILSNGGVITCSDTEHSDLFRGAAASLGTIGVVTLLEIRLEEAKNFQQAVHQCQALTSGADYDRLDFVDGIMFSKSSGAIISGRRTNNKPPGMPIQRFSAPSDPWFFTHVQERIADGKVPVTELIPLPEYLFRYDRAGFWVGYSIFKFSSIPFNSITRSLLDPFMHTRMLYAAQQAQRLNIQIIQDMAVPYSAAVEFLDWEAEKISIWPLWLCPLKQSPRPTLHPRVRGEEENGGPALNIGIWGAPKESTIEYWIDINQQLERKLHDVGGMKWMYGVNFQDEKQFWKSFDRKWYDGLRKKYHAEWMPSIFDKAATTPNDVCKRVESATWWDLIPFYFPGITLWCLYKAYMSGAMRWKRESTWMNWVPRTKTS